jgi:hypothetical protein
MMKFQETTKYLETAGEIREHNRTRSPLQGPSLQPLLLPSLHQYQQQWHQFQLPQVGAAHALLSSRQFLCSSLHSQQPNR